jgi:hypothetical protein
MFHHMAASPRSSKPIIHSALPRQRKPRANAFLIVHVHIFLRCFITFSNFSKQYAIVKSDPEALL